jgi:hypothetical protein
MQRFAYTPVVSGRFNSGYGLGIAERDVAGYCPQLDLGAMPSWEDAKARADALNADLGLDRASANDIIMSSLRAQNAARG